MASHQIETTPSVIVAVLIEHGGSGGRVAGPIANQVIHALQFEGYFEVSK
jgi:cell division protein FtsI/penicillin-binding protein 2